MGELVLSLAKTVVEGTLIKAKSAIDEEVKLRKSVQRDLVFITGEFQMMHSFLKVTNVERAKNDVVRTWLTQVRDLAYDVEDGIEFVVHLDKKPAWWCRLLPPCLLPPPLPLDEAADEIKELKARVEEVSQRNMRYSLISDSGSLPTAQTKQPVVVASNAAIALDKLAKARDAGKKWKGSGDLAGLIAMEDRDLQVISVWGTGVDIGTTSIIREAYNDPKTRENFNCRGWAKLAHAFNPLEFIRTLLTQFHINSSPQEGSTTTMEEDVLTNVKEVTATQDELIKKFVKQVNEKRYLVVLEDVSTMVLWDSVRAYLPDTKKGSRIVVSTEQFEVASLCIGHVYRLLELEQFSADHSVCVLFKKGPQCDGNEDQGADGADFWHGYQDELRKELIKKVEEKSGLIGRQRDIATLYRRMTETQYEYELSVTSVWGPPGVEKSTLVRSLYEYLAFDTYTHKIWFDVRHPFDLIDLCQSLCRSLPADESKSESESILGMVGIIDSIQHCRKYLHELGTGCLIFINGLHSTEEWDLIKTALLLPKDDRKSIPSNSVVVITDNESVAAHCADYVYHIGDREHLNALLLHKKEGPQCDRNEDQEADRVDSWDEPMKKVIKEVEEKYGLIGGQREMATLFRRIIETQVAPGRSVTSVWGLPGVRKSDLVRSLYEYLASSRYFDTTSWVDVCHPFDLRDLCQSLCQSLLLNLSEPESLEKAPDRPGMLRITDTIQLCRELLVERRCLIVIDGLDFTEEWDSIKAVLLLPENHNNHVIIITDNESVAAHCTDCVYHVRGLEHHDALLLLNEKKIQQNSPSASTSEVIHKPVHLCDGNDSNVLCKRRKYVEDQEADGEMKLKKLTSYEIIKIIEEKSGVIGRQRDMITLYDMMMKDTRWYLGCQNSVISVWGLPGVGKSTFVRSLYEHWPDHVSFYTAKSWVNVCHPFHLRDLCQSLLSNLSKFNSEYKPYEKAQDRFSILGIKDTIQHCCELLQEALCLIVIDGLHSTEEWDLIKATLLPEEHCNRVIVITDNESIAAHCAKVVFHVECLKHCDATFLFHKENTPTGLPTPGEIEKLVLKCGGLPKVIVAVARAYWWAAGWLQDWRNFESSFVHLLETHPDFESLRGLFASMHSYFRTCPDDLKPCVFYLPIFPQGSGIQRWRLVMRWVAEGYCRDTASNTAEENGEKLFQQLIKLNIIQCDPSDVSLYHVNNFFLEYIISRPIEENLVFALQERCSPTSQRTGRHLTIWNSWNREELVFKNIDFSRLRSLTVFGEWKSFLISDKMKRLRVLDLADTDHTLTDDDLEKIGELLTRLKFLSLRGCKKISRLPSSLSGLRQLQTLDITDTSVVKLPKAIIELEKLQYISACTDVSSQSRLVGAHNGGVKVPQGIGKLMALHTLGVVNVSAAGGEAFLKELKNEKLTQLCKLQVSGINSKNYQGFSSAISGHNHLESLSVRLDEEDHHGPTKKLSFKLDYLEVLEIHFCGDSTSRYYEINEDLELLPRIDEVLLEGSNADYTYWQRVNQRLAERRRQRAEESAQLSFD